MAHPSRRRFVDELLEQLGDVPVIWDREGDRWETGSRALRAHVETGATWGLTIQDDAILGRDCIPAAAKAAEVAGERPVSLYTGKSRPHQNIVSPAVKRAQRTGSPWLAMEGPWWGVGIVLPTAHIPELCEWGDAHPRIRNYDLRISRWYEQQGIDCWYTVPSLVDHREVGENPSLISGRTGNRQAHTFIGERSALEIDWSLPPLRVTDKQAVFSNENGQKRRARMGTVRYQRLTQNPRWTEEVPTNGRMGRPALA